MKVILLSPFFYLCENKRSTMILTVNYNKSDGSITVSSDISAITVSVNDNAINDTDSEVSFEVAVDTSTYEQINELPID